MPSQSIFRNQKRAPKFTLCNFSDNSAYRTPPWSRFNRPQGSQLPAPEKYPPLPTPPAEACKISNRCFRSFLYPFPTYTAPQEIRQSLTA